MIVASLVLLALTLFVAWDGSERVTSTRVFDSAEHSDSRNPASVAHQWSLALPFVSQARQVLLAKHQESPGHGLTIPKPSPQRHPLAIRQLARSKT